MNTSRGWARAKLRLAGFKPKYNSLLEAYYIKAIQKENIIESKKVIALSLAGSNNNEKLIEAINDYLEEIFPAIKEDRDKFVNNAQTILDQEAGKIVDISQFVKADSVEE